MTDISSLLSSALFPMEAKGPRPGEQPGFPDSLFPAQAAPERKPDNRAAEHRADESRAAEARASEHRADESRALAAPAPARERIPAADIAEASEPQDIPPSLTSDLSASVSTQVQEEAAPDTAEAPPLPAADDSLSMDDVAAMLGQLEPGSAPDVSMIDPSILQQLKEKFATLDLTNGAINHQILVTLKDDVASLMKENGFTTSEIQQLLKDLAKLMRGQDEIPTLPAGEIAPAGTEAAAETEEAAPSAEENNEAVTEAAVAAPAMAADAAVTQDLLDSGEDFAAAARAARNEASATAQDEGDAQKAAPPPPAPLQNNTANAKLPAAATAHAAWSDASGGDAGAGAEQFQPGAARAFGAATSEGSLDAAKGFANYMAAASKPQHNMTQMVSLQIQRNIAAKVDTMTLQLEPLELGRLDIRMKFYKDGSMKAHLSAEKPETLAMLQRDASYLERVLQQAGLDTDENSLSFDLRQQGRQQGAENSADNMGHGDDFQAHVNGVASEKATQAKIAVETYGYISQNGVNIVV